MFADYTRFHYATLLQAQVSICGWERLTLGDIKECALLKQFTPKMRILEEAISAKFKEVKSGFFGQMGAQKLPLVMAGVIKKHAGGDRNVAQIITNEIKSELKHNRKCPELRSLIWV
jgi:hypothetical protein